VRRGKIVGIIVQKYGGSSVADVEKLKIVANRVVAAKEAGHKVVVVVSAMGDTTDELLNLAKKVSQNPPRRELDMLLTCGERISMALLSMAIHEKGHKAISFTGSQSGIITNDRHFNARILEVRPYRIQDELDDGKIVIIAGYQGVSYKKEVTTLGRGGSDTTAVAMAAALSADYCEICSDVAGVYSSDPRVISATRLLEELSYDETEALGRAGAKVLCAEAIEFARQKGIAVYARATRGDPAVGTVVRRIDQRPPGAVRAVAWRDDIVTITAKDVGQPADVLARLRGPFEAFGVPDTRLFAANSACLACIPLEQVADPEGFCLALGQALGEPSISRQWGIVSLIGDGIGGRADLISQAIDLLTQLGITLAGVETATSRASLLIERDKLHTAAKKLHAVFIEEAVATEL
jgi:aspartate kinase